MARQEEVIYHLNAGDWKGTEGRQMHAGHWGPFQNIQLVFSLDSASDPLRQTHNVVLPLRIKSRHLREKGFPAKSPTQNSRTCVFCKCYTLQMWWLHPPTWHPERQRKCSKIPCRIRSCFKDLTWRPSTPTPTGENVRHGNSSARRIMFALFLAQGHVHMNPLVI